MEFFFSLRVTLIVLQRIGRPGREIFFFSEMCSELLVSDSFPPLLL